MNDEANTEAQYTDEELEKLAGYAERWLAGVAAIYPHYTEASTHAIDVVRALRTRCTQLEAERGQHEFTMKDADERIVALTARLEGARKQIVELESKWKEGQRNVETLRAQLFASEQKRRG